MDNSTHAQKKAIIQEFIAEDDIFVCINAKHEGVIVPPNHKGNVDLRLVLSMNFVNKPIFQDDYVESILLFGGIPKKCLLPYDAIWGVFNQGLKRLYFWQEDMPEEIATKMERMQEIGEKEETNPFAQRKKTAGKSPALKKAPPSSAPEAETEGKPQKSKPVFTVIENKSGKPEEKTAPEKRNRSHLKVLK